jgi:hypothetical protein
MRHCILCVLAALATSGLAIISVEVAFAQSDPWVGMWQFNVAQSKFSPRPPPKSASMNIQGEGQNHKVTITGIGPTGNPVLTEVVALVYDGTSYPVTGSPIYDAAASARVDNRTIIISRTKAGKLVQTSTWVMSNDGNTITITVTGTSALGPHNNIAVWDKL